MIGESKKKRFGFSSKMLGPHSDKGGEIYYLQALLSRYGHLREPHCPGVYDAATRRAVANYQSYYRLEVTDDGTCDETTLRFLSQPRCGLPDPPIRGRRTDGRLAPYVTVGAKWNHLALTYRYMNATADLPADRQRAIIDEAFRRWSAVCGLTFREVAVDAASDLSVAFHQGSHGDGAPFDNSGGPDGNVLAHAFFPPGAGGPNAGSLHFDEFESWKDQPGGVGIRLYNVALHEIGHLLGLDHSQDNTAIMFAYYAEDRNDLRPDDIAGVQSLYGAPATAPVALTPGQSVNGNLPQQDAEVRYQITLQSKLLVKLDGPAGQDFDLFVRHGQPVDRAAQKYDAVSWGVTADELVTIADPKPGTYHILVHSYNGSGPYSLEVDIA